MARKRRRRMRQQEDAAIFTEGIEIVIVWYDKQSFVIHMDGDINGVSVNGRLTALKFLLHELGGTPCLWMDWLLANGEIDIPDDFIPRCQRERR